MAGPCYITQDDLETRFGTRRVLDVFSDDGKNVTPRLQQACKVGSRKLDSLLGSAWTSEQIQTLVQGDEAIMALVCDLTMADGISTGRPEWNAVDNPPYANLEKQARQLLELYSTGELNTPVLSNPQQRAGVAIRRQKRMFVPHKDGRQRGGY